MLRQLRAANPNIPCTPGYCLVYVRQTFGVAASGNYPTALSNWNNSVGNHPNEGMPSGIQVPIFFTVNGNSAGHVALSMGDGSIYSSSSSTSHTPVLHPSLAAMQRYWNNGTMLNYLGWKEYVEDTQIISQEDDMAIINNGDNWRGRMNKDMQRIRGRDMNDGEFANWQGQDHLHWIEALEDDVEADLWYNDGTVGRVAQNDNWQGQIEGLTQKISDVNTALTQAQSDNTADKSTIDALTAQVNDLTAKLATVQAPTHTDGASTTPTKTTLFDYIAAFLKGFVRSN